MSTRATLVQVVSVDYPEWMAVMELLVNRDLQACVAMTACTVSWWVLSGPTSTESMVILAFRTGDTDGREKCTESHEAVCVRIHFSWNLSKLNLNPFQKYLLSSIKLFWDL